MLVLVSFCISNPHSTSLSASFYSFIPGYVPFLILFTKTVIANQYHFSCSVAGGSASAEDKVKALEAAGVRIAVHPGEIGGLMRELLEERGLVEKKGVE